MDRYGDLRKNGSGYTDPTPYQALTSMYNPGEIWTHTNSGNEVLILKDHDGFCTVLRLVDEEGKAGCISIVSRAMKYTHPGMVQYVFNTQLGMMVKKLPDEEFKAVQEAVASTLGLPVASKQPVQNVYLESSTGIVDVTAIQRASEAFRKLAHAVQEMADSLESGDGR